MGRWAVRERERNETAILALWQEDPGITYTEISEQLGIARQTVAQVYQRLALPTSSKRNSRLGRAKLSRDEEVMLARMYVEQKITLDAIEGHLGISRATVYATLKKLNIPLRGMGCGPDHPCWQGGRKINPDGYVEVWMSRDHPFAAMMRRQDGYVVEHRLVMAEHLGRSLSRYETVHHKNGIHDDNEISNLQLRTHNHGAGIVLRCRSCGSHDIESEEL